MEGRNPTLSSLSEIAFFALGRLSRSETTPGWSGTGSRYASAGPAAAVVCVWMNRRPAPHGRVRPHLSAVLAGPHVLSMSGVMGKSKAMKHSRRVQQDEQRLSHGAHEPDMAGRVTSWAVGEHGACARGSVSTALLSGWQAVHLSNCLHTATETRYRVQD